MMVFTYSSRIGAGPGRGDLDRVVVDAPGLADGGGEGLEVRAGKLRALDREHDVVGGEGRAVVEPDALPQVEAPGRGVHLLPGGGERGDELEVAVARGEALVEVVGEQGVDALVLGVRVGGEEVALRGPAEDRRGRRRGGDEQRDKAAASNRATAAARAATGDGARVGRVLFWLSVRSNCVGCRRLGPLSRSPPKSQPAAS